MSLPPPVPRTNPFSWYRYHPIVAARRKRQCGSPDRMSGRARGNGGDTVKMSDIARHAGVSPMTVSRALRDPATVSEKMRRKVDAAVREFGYLPNRIAGSLSSSRSNVVGLIVPSIRNSLYASMIQAISDMLRANGLHLMIANSGHRLDDEEALASAF